MKQKRTRKKISKPEYEIPQMLFGVESSKEFNEAMDKAIANVIGDYEQYPQPPKQAFNKP